MIEMVYILSFRETHYDSMERERRFFVFIVANVVRPSFLAPFSAPSSRNKRSRSKIDRVDQRLQPTSVSPTQEDRRNLAPDFVVVFHQKIRKKRELVGFSNRLAISGISKRSAFISILTVVCGL